jgi:endonuclease-3
MKSAPDKTSAFPAAPAFPAARAFPIARAISILRREVRQWDDPIVTKMAKTKRDPFRVLIATILSLRTKDACTAEAAARLFALADTPEGLLRIPAATIAKTIYPVGFYNTKARNIHSVCRDLLERFGGRAPDTCAPDARVPDTIEELLTLQGVGRKTANLVLSQGYGIPAICVDTHVHRITNRWGYVTTRNPEETEMRLRGILPRRYWIILNDLLVTYGQNLCAPVSPWCSRCKLRAFCARIGVARSR